MFEILSTMKITEISRRFWPFSNYVTVTMVPSNVGIFEAAKTKTEFSVAKWAHISIGYGEYKVKVSKSIPLKVGSEIALQEVVNMNEEVGKSYKALYPFCLGYLLFAEG